MLQLRRSVPGQRPKQDGRSISFSATCRRVDDQLNALMRSWRRAARRLKTAGWSEASRDEDSLCTISQRAAHLKMAVLGGARLERCAIGQVACREIWRWRARGNCRTAARSGQKLRRFPAQVARRGYQSGPCDGWRPGHQGRGAVAASDLA